MNKNSLKNYLLKVAKEGYTTNDEKSWKKEADSSTTIVHSDEEWSMNDNFFGGEPYGGREVIFYEAKPVWIMVYYGKVEKKIAEVGKIYAFLQKALYNTDLDCPLRGPKLLEEGEMRYENEWTGNIEELKGNEKILLKGIEIYSAEYVGGLIDQRKE